jgi:multisubunit Na+/H+ antiporter MnhC subunit
MSAHVIAVDLVALLFAVTGFYMAFRQRVVRRWIGAAARPRAANDDEDPVHYALLIFGMMIMAFGIILFGFTTFYAILTS